MKTLLLILVLVVLMRIDFLVRQIDDKTVPYRNDAQQFNQYPNPTK